LRTYKNEIEITVDNENSDLLGAFLHDFWNILCHADYLQVIFDDDTIAETRGKIHTFNKMYGWRIKTIEHLRNILDKLVESSRINVNEMIIWETVILSHKNSQDLVDVFMRYS